MEDKKLRTILQDMEGITYLEWQKVKQMVDAHFISEAAKKIGYSWRPRRC